MTQGVRQRIEPNKADHCDGLAILRTAATGRSYGKVADSQRILALAAPSVMAQNSRSFRRFLRCSHHPSYTAQSRTPA
jgi:hypothetical protein